MTKMKTKTFKIGEWCKGGVITVEIQGDTVAVIAKDWDFSAGSSKHSDQSNAKEFDRETVNLSDRNAYNVLDGFLNGLTTAYYAGQVIDWIKANVKSN